MICRLLSILWLVAGLGLPAYASAATLPEGSSQTTLRLPGALGAIALDRYVPPQATARSPVVFVLAGIGRNASDYRDSWIASANRYGFVILAPRFPQRAYPGVSSYTLGDMRNPATGKTRPRAAWSFSAVEAIFARLRQRGETERTTYYLFGHSAGCQFVHRLLTFTPHPHLAAAICAAAGWWTLPNAGIHFPYGLKHAPVHVSRARLAAYFALPLLISVGDQDTNPRAPHLRRTRSAEAQGPNRLRRAWHYYSKSRQIARRDHLPFDWTFQIMPGVGHDFVKTAPYAAAQFALFERTGHFGVQPPATLAAARAAANRY